MLPFNRPNKISVPLRKHAGQIEAALMWARTNHYPLVDEAFAELKIILSPRPKRQVRCGKVINRTAAVLGVSRQGVHAFINKHGVEALAIRLKIVAEGKPENCTLELKKLIAAFQNEASQ